jgi:hypothetical protein
MVEAILSQGTFAVAGGVRLVLHDPIRMTWNELLTNLSPLTYAMSQFAVAMAFPLAVRMALSLSELRAKLDGATQAHE